MPFGDKEDIAGWGVFRVQPWDFIGVFPRKDLAEEAARNKGSEYIVRYGYNEKGTTNFAWKNESLIFGSDKGESEEGSALGDADNPDGNAI